MNRITQAITKYAAFLMPEPEPDIEEQAQRAISLEKREMEKELRLQGMSRSQAKRTVSQHFGRTTQ